MPSVLERLREALASRYELEEEIGRGGMGLVFVGRDLQLGRKVAIKVLRPELATAQAAGRFLREARILASLSHSHVIAIHEARSAGGLFYYVMEYVDDETLDRRLERGRLSRADALKLGRDLLDALEAVHERGIVHRDIKPSNIFLLGRRALLADFGIAKGGPEVTALTETQPGVQPGTLAYMAPEQRAGGEVTPATDLYAVGLVSYEALSGQRWVVGTPPNRGDWSSVPRPMARVLRRALAIAPEDRWPDAATFRRRLWHARTVQYRMRTALLTMAGVAVGALVVPRLWPPQPPPAPELTVQVDAFQPLGPTEPWLGDSVARFVARSLSQSPDFRVCPPGESCPRATARLRGSVATRDTILTIRVLSQGVTASARGPLHEWWTVADSVTYGVLRSLWSRQSALAEWLPRRALPTTTAGFSAWLRAEHLLDQARWGDALTAYVAAVEADSTCWLCSWRITEVQRQLVRPQDPAHRQRAVQAIDSFPPHYRPLIMLESLESPDARFDTLEAVTENWRDFYYAWFRLGEELFNRGPLSGRLRREALPPLRETARLRPDFGPAWELLTWVSIAEGDEAGATEALASLLALPAPEDPFSVGYRTLLQLAKAYRFGGLEMGGGVAQAILANPALQRVRELPAGARLLPNFDLPHAAIDFGERFTRVPQRRDLELSGLIAQLFGYLALGRPAAARQRAGEIQWRFPDRESFPLFAAELDAVLVLFDSAGADVDVGALGGKLARYAAPRTGTGLEQRRAAFSLSLLSRHHGVPDAGRSYRRFAVSDVQPHPMSLLLRADLLADRGDVGAALEIGEELRTYERAKYAETTVGPFFRTVLHFLRSRWYEAAGNVVAAYRELRWPEGWDQQGLPVAEPRVEEVDWAFGTIARWQRAALLRRARSSTVERCDVVRTVERLWRGGEPVYAARADSAGREVDEICPVSSPG